MIVKTAEYDHISGYEVLSLYFLGNLFDLLCRYVCTLSRCGAGMGVGVGQVCVEWGGGWLGGGHRNRRLLIIYTSFSGVLFSPLVQSVNGRTRPDN